jgi:phosphosulfolactate synthase (CoM biosynthesis protein A)
VDKVHSYGLKATGTSDPSKIINLGKRLIGAGVKYTIIGSEGITENVESWRTDVVQTILRELPMEKVMFETADPKVFNWYIREFGIDHSQIAQLMLEDRHLGNGGYVWENCQL